MDNVFDLALHDFFHHRQQGPLLIHNKYGKPDEMDLAAYFRQEDDLSDLEACALSLVQGKTLDIGAGVGSISLILQAYGLDITALEVSAVCSNIMQQRGVQKVVRDDFFTFQPARPYDTLLLMMNGLGICGTLSNLPAMLVRFEELLAPGGQVLFDSSDVSYIDQPSVPATRYMGEMDYRYEYQGQRGGWFTWLYIDSDRLKAELTPYNFNLQIVMEDANGQYLGRLTRQ